MRILSRLNRNYWLKSGIINLLQNFVTLVVSFGSFYFLIRILDKGDFGIWVLFMSTVSIMEFARTGLISKSLITYLSSNAVQEHNFIITTSFIINLLVTAILSITCYLCAPFLCNLWGAPQLIPIFNLYLIAFAVTAFMVQYNAIEQAYLQFNGVFLSNLVKQLVLMGFILYKFFMAQETTLITLVQVMIVGGAAATLVSILFVNRSFLLFGKLDKRWMKQLLHYGKYSFGTNMAAVISGSVDQMMIGGLVSPVSAGIYNIAVRITNMINVPTNAMATIVFPQSARRLEDQGDWAVKYLYEKSVGTVLAMLLPVATFAFFLAEPIVHFIGDNRYPETIPLLQITLFSVLFVPYTKQFGTILESIGRVKLNFYITLISVTFNVALNYLFIRQWGIIGAATATLFSYFLLFITTQIILKRTLDISFSAVWIYAFRSYGEIYYRFMGNKGTEEAKH